MRSFQKKLTATAAGAALIAALGVAFAQSTQSSDPLDAHSAVASPDQSVSQSTQTKTINGADRSTNGPLYKAPAQADTSQQATAPTDSSSSMSSDNSSSTATDNSAATTTDSTPAPRADRN